MFARSYIHLVRHKSRANQGRAGLVSTQQLQSRYIEVSSQNSFTKDNWVKNWPGDE